MLLVAIAVAAAQLAEPRPQPPAPHCAIARPTIFYERLADMPAEIRADVAKHGAIADAGQPFNEYDFDVDPHLPDRGFILGGSSGGNWFVWLRHGGFDRHDHVLGYRALRSRVNEAPTPVLEADFTEAPCAAINAFLNGVDTNLGHWPDEH